MGVDVEAPAALFVWMGTLDIAYFVMLLVVVLWIWLSNEEDNNLFQSSQMRWWTLAMIVMRMIFVTMCAFAEGQLYYDRDVSDLSLGRLVERIFYAFIEEGSAFGKLVIIVVIFYRVANILAFFIANGEEHEELQTKRLELFRRCAAVGVFADASHRCVSVSYWAFDANLARTASGFLYLIPYLLFWSSFTVFVITLFKIREESKKSYMQVRHIMGVQRRRKTEKILRRLDTLCPMFLAWLLMYLLYCVINVIHFFDYNDDVPYLAMIHRLSLFWVYWWLSDLILFSAIIYYLEPKDRNPSEWVYHAMGNEAEAEINDEPEDL